MGKLIAVAPLAALADGEMLECRAAGADVLLCNVFGQYYAVAARCPHAGQRLATGRLDGFTLYCPLHRASFDVRSGAVLSGPAQEPLACYPTETGAGRVSVEVDA
jgi:nitrite reductase/ring-hydroxylating ferredoxin subunit